MRICDICKNEMTTNDCLMPGDNPTGIQDAWLDCTGIIVGWDNVQIRIRGKSKEGVIDGNRIMAMDVCPKCVPALLIRLLHNRIRPEDDEPAKREAAIVKSEEREIHNPPEVAELRKTLESIRDQTKCNNRCWFKEYHRHAPDCLWSIAAEANDALEHKEAIPEAVSPTPEASSPPLHEPRPTSDAPASEPEDVQSWQCDGCGAVNNQVFKDCGSCHRLKPISCAAEPAERVTHDSMTQYATSAGVRSPKGEAESAPLHEPRTTKHAEGAEAWQASEGRAAYPA